MLHGVARSRLPVRRRRQVEQRHEHAEGHEPDQQADRGGGEQPARAEGLAAPTRQPPPAAGGRLDDAVITELAVRDLGVFDDVARAIQLRVSGYVLKPFTAETFRRVAAQYGDSPVAAGAFQLPDLFPASLDADYFIRPRT